MPPITPAVRVGVAALWGLALLISQIRPAVYLPFVWK